MLVPSPNDKDTESHSKSQLAAGNTAKGDLFLNLKDIEARGDSKSKNVSQGPISENGTSL